VVNNLQSVKLRIAAYLFKYAYPVYKVLYYNFKQDKDAFNLKFIKGILKPGDIAVDVGANIGFYTQYLAKCVGATGKVWAFEPDAINFKHLTNAVKNWPQVICKNQAVAAQNGNLILYASGLLNIDHRTYQPASFTHSYSVNKIALDHELSNCTVRLIKMDIQGFEMDALQGMKNLLMQPDVILISELWPYGLNEAGSSAIAMFEFLKNLGFGIYTENKGKLHPITGKEVMEIKIDFMVDTNIIAARNIPPEFL